MISWDERYSHPEYVYGTEPNVFLQQQVHRIPHGRVLCLGEGEGRNSVYLASLGYDVTAVDASAVGLAKARSLAEQRQVTIETIHSDLHDYEIVPNSWHGIVSIFCHIPPDLRRRLHHEVTSGLVSGGVFILEAYTPNQLQYGTGGPPTVVLMMSARELADELAGLDLLINCEKERVVVEGLFHNGTGAVVQVVGRRAP